MKSLVCLAVLACCIGEVRADESESPAIVEMHVHANTIRARSGLAGLLLDRDLTRLAQSHANWMASVHSMQHGAHDHIIAMSSNGNVDEAFRLWLGSPPHRSFVLGGASHAGWGVARASNGYTYWAGIFRHRGVVTVQSGVVSTPENGDTVPHAASPASGGCVNGNCYAPSAFRRGRRR